MTPEQRQQYRDRGGLYTPKRTCASCRERRALVGGRVLHGQFTCAACREKQKPATEAAP